MIFFKVSTHRTCSSWNIQYHRRYCRTSPEERCPSQWPEIDWTPARVGVGWTERCSSAWVGTFQFPARSNIFQSHQCCLLDFVDSCQGFLLFIGSSKWNCVVVSEENFVFFEKKRFIDPLLWWNCRISKIFACCVLFNQIWPVCN